MGKDFEIGLKLPVYMDKIGLKNVNIRVNDYVNFVNPSNQEHKNNLEAFSSANTDNKMTKESKEGFVKSLVNRGLTEQEAEHEFEGQLKISEYLYEHKDKIHMVRSNCMFISYGYNI